MIQLPKITKTTSGMFLRHSSWHIFYYEDGKTRTRSLGTPDIEKARTLRDEIYGILRAQGATERNEKRGRPVTKNGIYTQYKVRAAGHKTRYVKSLEEAEQIRDWMLANPATP
jgi:hypothetical protein